MDTTSEAAIGGAILKGSHRTARPPLASNDGPRVCPAGEEKKMEYVKSTSQIRILDT